MRDPLTDLLYNGAHHFLLSGLWVLLFVTLSLLMVRSLSLALASTSRHHPLVWLVLALSLWVVMLMLWCVYQPDLSWGLLGLGLLTVGVVAPVLRPRPRRFRSWS